MKKRIFFYSVILFLTAGSCKKNTASSPPDPPSKKPFESAAVINSKLGHGTNYSGMFEESTGMRFDPNYARAVARAGFKHVRIATRWERDDRSMSTPPYTINNSFIGVVKQAIDSAISNGLYVIINMQNHWALMGDPDGQKARFLAEWRQISAAYKDYPDSLLFELLNEPQGNMTPEKWNDLSAAALAVIREDNPDRTVLIDPRTTWNTDLASLTLPNDDHIILTPHYYRPFDLTHQGLSWSDQNSMSWVGTEWWDTEPEREIMRRELAPLKDFAVQHHVPIHIGEFGISNAAEVASRTKWITFTTHYFDQMGWSWAFFNFKTGSFGNIDASSSGFNQYLLDAVQHSTLPNPAPYTGVPLYSSELQSGKDELNLVLSGGATGNAAWADNALNINIVNGGTLNWNVQLSKRGITLKKGSKYHVSFEAKADAPHDIDVFFTKTTSPYTYYYTSINNKVTLTNTYKPFDFILDMHDSDDNSARMGIDMGGSDGNISFRNIKIEEMAK